MRGKGKMAVQVNRETRITPAYAGKSTGNCFAIHIKWDHPRLCGEKLGELVLVRLGFGSPPPMRGKAFSTSASCSAMRITPAYAGKRFRAIRNVNEY